MKTRSLLFASALLVAAACGDDSNPTRPDASGGSCASATGGEISSYPGTFSGTVVGGGRDHTAAENACTEQTGDAWYDPKGEDIVVKLSGLTPGTVYVIAMTTTEDLSFYVTTGCPPASGAVTDCISFTDESYENESGVFTASLAEHYLIIDNAEDTVPTDGTFSLEVTAAECTVDTEATDCQAPTPFCLANTCVACLSSFDCSGATPVCDANGACVAGPSACTGDDVEDTTAPGDDGPSAATVLATPTLGNPTVFTGAVCNTPSDEGDWFKLELAAAGDIGVKLAFTGATNDLDVYLIDAEGAVVARGESGPGIAEGIRGANLTGTHYVLVTQYEPTGTVAAVPYTLTVGRPACDNDTECTIAASPLCSGAGLCEAGPTQCVGDDAAEPDDGPAASRNLTGALDTDTTLTGSVCSVPRTERDWYRVTTTAAGEGLTVTLTWTGAQDLDPTVFDSNGTMVGTSFWLNPEVVTLTHLPIGTYYIRVNNASATATTAVQAYSITARRTAVQTCTTPTDCATTHSTQVYRGSCAAGSCQFITTTGGANASACDSGPDCTSGRCSYILFESDAQDSVCTTTCTTSADCAGLGGGYTCTDGLQTNFCVPSCTGPLECGAILGSDTLDANQPWDYLTCTTGVCSF